MAVLLVAALPRSAEAKISPDSYRATMSLDIEPGGLNRCDSDPCRVFNVGLT